MDTILKVEVQGDLRRAVLESDPCYADVASAIQEMWPGRTISEARYKDDEGDLCRLNEATFPDFLAISGQDANGKRTLRLELGVAAPIDVSSADRDKAADEAEDKSSPQFVSPAASPRSEADGDDEADQCLEDHGFVVIGVTSQSQDVETPLREDSALPPSAEVCPAAMVEGRGVLEESGYPASQNVDDMEDMQEYHISTPKHSPRGQASAEAAVETDVSPTLRMQDDAGYTINGVAPDDSSVVSEKVVDDLVIDHDTNEKIDIIIAAFDETGDVHLNYREMNSLHYAAWGGEISLEVFQQMCAEEGEDADAGLGREALMCIYSRSRDLEKDFETARLRLYGEDEEGLKRQKQARATPASLILKNPLLAVPFALDATERVRQKVASQLTSLRGAPCSS